MSQRILVFGGRGFLGRPLVERLSSLGHDVHSASRSQGQEAAGQHCQVDICDAEGVAKVVSDLEPQWVINATAYGVQYGQSDEDLARSVNVEAARSLCEISTKSRSVKRYLHIGSCFEYGHQDGPIPEDCVPAPATLYARTKAEGTAGVVDLAGQTDTAVVVARLFSLWGEEEPKGRLFRSVVEAALTNAAIDLTPCAQLRDYLHVKDVVNQIVGLLSHTGFGRDSILNLASGDARSLRDYLISINGIFGNRAQLNFGARQYREGEMMSLIADTKKLKQYGLEPGRSFEERCIMWREANA